MVVLRKTLPRIKSEGLNGTLGNGVFRVVSEKSYVNTTNGKDLGIAVLRSLGKGS